MASTFGQNLKRLREAGGMTQEALMRQLRLKTTTPISLWESRRTLPRPSTIVRIANALGCEPRELLENVETPYDSLRAGRPLENERALKTKTRRAG